MSKKVFRPLTQEEITKVDNLLSIGQDTAEILSKVNCVKNLEGAEHKANKVLEEVFDQVFEIVHISDEEQQPTLNFEEKKSKTIEHPASKQSKEEKKQGEDKSVQKDTNDQKKPVQNVDTKNNTSKESTKTDMDGSTSNTVKKESSEMTNPTEIFENAILQATDAIREKGTDKKAEIKEKIKESLVNALKADETLKDHAVVVNEEDRNEAINDIYDGALAIIEKENKVESNDNAIPEAEVIEESETTDTNDDKDEDSSEEDDLIKEANDLIGESNKEDKIVSANTEEDNNETETENTVNEEDTEEKSVPAATGIDADFIKANLSDLKSLAPVVSHHIENGYITKENKNESVNSLIKYIKKAYDNREVEFTNGLSKNKMQKTIQFVSTNLLKNL